MAGPDIRVIKALISNARPRAGRPSVMSGHLGDDTHEETSRSTAERRAPPIVWASGSFGNEKVCRRANSAALLQVRKQLQDRGVRAQGFVGRGATLLLLAVDPYPMYFVCPGGDHRDIVGIY